MNRNLDQSDSKIEFFMVDLIALFFPSQGLGGHPESPRWQTSGENHQEPATLRHTLNSNFCLPQKQQGYE